MESSSHNATHHPRGRYFGWYIVAISVVFYAMSGGFYSTGLTVYFLPLVREFNISHTMMSLMYALRTLEGGMEGPLVGFLVDRFGPRRVLLAGVLMGGLGFILLAGTQSYAMFLTVFLLLVVVGMSTPHSSLSGAINLWFRRRLGIAMSLAVSGAAIGGFLLTPVVAWVVLTHSWRWATLGSGLLVLLAGIPLSMLVRRPRGEEAIRDEPVPPAGQQASVAPGHRAAQAGPRVDFAVSEALRTPTYWLLALAIGLRVTCQSALQAHMVPILVSKGVGEGVAATLVAVAALIRFPGMIGAGLMADRWSRPRMVSFSMLAGTLAAAALVWGPGGITAGVLFAILFAGATSSNAITWALVGQYFGRRNFGSLRGGVSLIQGLMSMSGPIAAGQVFDRTGSYSVALVGILVIYAASALLFWVMKTPVSPMPKDAGQREYRFA